MNQSRRPSRFISPSLEPFEHFTISRGKTRPGFETLPCLLARVWPDGKLVLLNPAWDLLGYDDEELVARSFCELIALERQAACAALRSLLAFDEAIEFSLRCKDQRQMRYHWNRCPQRWKFPRESALPCRGNSMRASTVKAPR